jgi:membrane-bound lytic murein transglycosylase A
MKGTPHGLRNPSRIATLVVALVCVTAAARDARSASNLLPLAELQFEPLQWDAIEGWREDDQAAALAVFQASCRPLVARLKRRKDRAPRDIRPMRPALTEICLQAMKVNSGTKDAAARKFFEKNFRPVRIGKLGEDTGLLTGYYEPIIEGSRFPSDIYDVPIYAKPSNLVVAGRRRAKEEGFPNKGRVGRRLGRKKIVPYYDRGEIEDGILAGRGLEICWVKDPIDAFFMQIQGSARVKLDTGSTLRLNYAAHNGHPYTPVGRILIQRDLVSKEQMSMDRIRAWMEQNPEEAKELRRENRSYVFMRETGLAADAEPTGAQGISLTAGRSIAVDRKLHVYGTPFFISAELPIHSERPVTPFRRLMVAQDTGSAIVGPARADIYFGAGEQSGRIAGRITQRAQFVMLVPRALDPARSAAALPVPQPRPPQPYDPILAPVSPSFVSTPPVGPSGSALAYAPAAAAASTRAAFVRRSGPCLSRVRGPTRSHRCRNGCWTRWRRPCRSSPARRALLPIRNVRSPGPRRRSLPPIPLPLRSPHLRWPRLRRLPFARQESRRLGRCRGRVARRPPADDRRTASSPAAASVGRRTDAMERGDAGRRAAVEALAGVSWRGGQCGYARTGAAAERRTTAAGVEFFTAERAQSTVVRCPAGATHAPAYRPREPRDRRAPRSARSDTARSA